MYEQPEHLELSITWLVICCMLTAGMMGLYRVHTKVQSCSAAMYRVHICIWQRSDCMTVHAQVAAGIPASDIHQKYCIVAHGGRSLGRVSVACRSPQPAKFIAVGEQSF